MLEVKQLAAGYGESVILRDISLRVPPGQVVALLGRNGVGKTTLMKALMGVIKARNGRILIGNADLTRHSPDRRIRAGIGYVPQGREIFPQLTVHENLLLGLEGMDRRTRAKGVPEKALELFPVIKTMFRRRGGDLSGGQQQQLAFARALAAGPDLLLLDEPTEGIQPSIVQEIQEVICTLKSRGDTSILLVEQSLEFVRRVADYYYILQKGEIVSEGTVDRLGDEAVKRYLLV